MYQTQPYIKQTDKDFDNLYNLFKEEILKTVDLEEDNKEYDLTKTYEINWACIWNSPKHLNKECVILQKNDKVALVFIKFVKGMDDNLLQHIYRLEDLTLTNMKSFIEHKSN